MFSVQMIKAFGAVHSDCKCNRIKTFQFGTGTKEKNIKEF